MGVNTTGDKIGKQIADILGIKHCRMIDLHLQAGRPATIKAEFYLEDDEGFRKFPPMFQNYELVEIDTEKETDFGEVTEFDQEIADFDLEAIKYKEKGK